MFEPTHKLLREPLQQLARESVLIGTSSWKYSGWCGQVYDESRYVTTIHKEAMRDPFVPLRDFSDRTHPNLAQNREALSALLDCRCGFQEPIQFIRAYENMAKGS